MSISVTCIECGNSSRVKRLHLGKRLKCPKCGKIQRIAGGQEASPSLKESEAVSDKQFSEDDILNILNTGLVSTPDDRSDTPPEISQPVNEPKPVWYGESANAKKNANSSDMSERNNSGVRGNEDSWSGLKIYFFCLSIFLFLVWVWNSGVGGGRGNHDDALFDADQAAEEAMRQIMSTPEGRNAVEYTGNKDVQLTRFQQAYGISDRIAEAAIKEWVLSHNGNFDWNLNEVKAICLRMK